MRCVPIEDQNDNEYGLELAKIIERNRNVRTIAICVTVVLSIGMIVYGAVRIFAQPAWVVLLVSIIGPLLSSPVIYSIWQSRRRFIRKHHHRQVSSETRHDPARQSSADGK